MNDLDIDFLVGAEDDDGSRRSSRASSGRRGRRRRRRRSRGRFLAPMLAIIILLGGVGARGESLEQYTKRLRDLEEIAARHTGVEKVYAMQAGREIRVIVHPEEVDDDTAALLSHRIARDVERELEYAGQIKVTVIRERRSVDFAK